MPKKRRTNMHYDRGKAKKLSERVEFIESCPESPLDEEFMSQIIKKCNSETKVFEEARRWLKKQKKA